MSEIRSPTTSRRKLLIGAAALAAGAVSRAIPVASTVHAADRINSGGSQMSFIKTKDGTEIFFKDWGKGQPIVFSHGWPLSADDWDTQMLFFMSMAIASLPMIGAGMAGPPNQARAMTWTTMQMIWRP